MCVTSDLELHVVVVLPLAERAGLLHERGRDVEGDDAVAAGRQVRQVAPHAAAEVHGQRARAVAVLAQPLQDDASAVLLPTSATSAASGTDHELAALCLPQAYGSRLARPSSP